MLRRLVITLFAVVVLGTAATFVGYLRLRQWSQATFELPGEQLVELKPGLSLAQFASQLEQQEVISSAALFYMDVRLRRDYRQFQAGRYRFQGEVSPEQVITTIIKGEVYQPVVLQITIPEGFTMKAVIERLAANGVGHVVALRNLVKDPTFLQNLKVPATSLEGFLYPATYSFHEVPSPRQALELMVKTFWQNLPKDYEQRVGQMGLNLQQAVTFASLIELETRRDDERPLVSEVIWRRLKDKIPLAIDAALIYGIPDYAGDLKWVHLSDAKNPYNTRIHLGLPPTPIGSPSAKSLEAVLTPSDLGYYYYVLIPGDTRHQFSRTLKEHNQHVKKLVNGTKQEKGQNKN